MSAAIIAAVALGLAAWVGVRGLLAKAELDQAKALISPMAAEASSFDLVGARTTFAEIQRHTSEAAALTSDPVWRALEITPWVGRNLAATRELSAVTDEMVTAVAPLVAYTEKLDPTALVPQGGAIPLDPIMGLVPLLEDATEGVAAADARLARIDTEGTVAQIAGGAATLEKATDRLLPALEQANSVVPLLPVLLGADGAQEYALMFQNNAEARSLGGTALFFALVNMDGGRIGLDMSIPAGDPVFRSDGTSPVAVPEGFEQMAPHVFGRFIPNATSRPDFPSAAETVSATFSNRLGVSPQGVVSIDAVTLAYLLRATGPVTLADGTVLDSTNAVPLLLNTLPQQHNSRDAEADNAALDVVYKDVVAQVFSKLSSGQFDVVKLFSAVSQASSERRLMFWSARPEVQSVIEAAGIDNAIPDSDDDVDRIGVYVNDNVGSKLNFFLNTSLETATATCGADGERVHRLTLKLDNQLTAAAAPSLSTQISGLSRGRSDGTQKFIIYVYVPTNGAVLGAAVNGVPAGVTGYVDDGHPVQRLEIAVPVESSGNVTVFVTTVGSPDRTLDVIVTPGVTPVARTVGTLSCADLPAS